MPDRDQMIRRQRVLADFGDLALRSEDLQEILDKGCRLVALALGTGLARVLETDHNKQNLLVRAAVGWGSDVVGRLRLPLGEYSPDTTSIAHAEPVLTCDLEGEKRVDSPRLMVEQGVRAIANVPILLPGGRAYGLLQVGSATPRDFVEQDIQFLRTFATMLGPVIDRLLKIRDLQVALDRNRHLMQELQHRIKNHIGVITGLVRMRRREVASDEARLELGAIGDRIETLRLVHEQLYAAGAADRLRVRPFVTRLVENLCQLHDGQAGPVRLDLAVEEVEFDGETAVPLGLILNEFVTNSLKYAFDGQGGIIAVVVRSTELGSIHVQMSDNGKGLAARVQASPNGSGTGMKLIAGLASQIGARPAWSSNGGTTLSLDFVPR